MLKDIGVVNIPTIYAFNKIDKVDKYLYIPNEYPEAVRTSATTNKGVDVLIKRIEENVFAHDEQLKLLIPYSDTKYINYLKTNANVEKMEYLENGTQVIVKVNKQIKQKISKFIINE